MHRNKEYQHPEYDLTIVERYLGQPYTADEYVVIPYAGTGYGATAVEVANGRYLESDSNMVGRLNLDEVSHALGTYWVAIIDDYSNEDFEELEELIGELNDYPVLCDSTYSEVEEELRMEYVRFALPYDSDITADEFMAASYELELYIEPDGDTYYMPDDDFEAVLQHARDSKSKELANA